MKTKIKLIWQLYPSYLIIVLTSLFAVSLFATNALKNFYIDQTKIYLQNQASLLKHEIYQYIKPLNSKHIDKICKTIGNDVLIRVTILFPNGDIIGDSEEAPSEMDNHADRPEIRTASSGNIGSYIRYSRTLHKNMMYVAIPLRDNKHNIIAIIRTSIPLTFIENSLQKIELEITMAGGIIALLISIVCLFISRMISRPIEEMKTGAERFAQGDFTFKLHIPGTKELAKLAEAMNKMAIQLEDRIKTVLKQQNEIEAILSSMLEGVIAVDKEEKIFKINESAMKMLDSISTSKDYIGKNIQEIIRNIKIHEFVNETLSQGKINEGDIAFHYKNKKIINFSCIPLHDLTKNTIGVLFVLNEVTHIRHLENVRKDFVANVSHELRTPLTAIKGFVETLLSGAMDDPDKTKSFLKIIDKHAERLTSIIKDLLQLSKIEKDSIYEEIDRKTVNLIDVILSAKQICQLEIHNKNIKINISCEKDLTYKLNTVLIEQAIVNLLDNAIKFSPNNSEIDIESKLSNGQLVISVKDNGTGIEKKHLDRLFERFYRVDKARSRKMGGTGLGLAIVKHIAQAHQGSVHVESTLGQGSIFSIWI